MVERRCRLTLLVAVLSLGAGTLLAAPSHADGEVEFEVWAIDQSDTTSDGGGTLYIYDGSALSESGSAVSQAIDLGGATRDLCLARTGSAPRRPHMLAFDSTGGYAIVSFVATGHVLFVNAAERTPVECIDVGAQAHAAHPSPDRSYVVVANQNGKLLQRISTNYAAGVFTLDSPATLNLATCTTPSGSACEQLEVRPDNAPICPVVDATSRFTFVTLRGGGLFVVDSTTAPMSIVAEYDRATVHPNGCGGVEDSGKMYINSGGGTGANPTEADLYAFPMSGFSTTPSPPNTPAPKLVFSHDDRGFVDSHGMVLTRKGRHLWVADRAANRMVVVDTSSDTVANEFALASSSSSDPAPDLLAISPTGNRVFAALRGPNPLTGNATGVNNAVGATPGVGVIRVQGSGASGTLQHVAPITHVVDSVERADPHSIGVRRK